MSHQGSEEGSPTRVSLPYGGGTAEASVPGGRCIGTLSIKDVPGLADPEHAIQEALVTPIGLSRSTFELVQPGETVAVIVSDSFRQTRADLILKVLVEGLLERGISEKHITFTFATGTHRGPTPEEQTRILGKGIAERFEGQIYTHDPEDAQNLVHLGETRRGTPVEINRRVHESDRILVTGSVVLHYFGGFGGGRKSVVPGIASVETIARNHARNLHATEDRLDPAVRIGRLEGNPVAEDMLEASKLTHVDAIVNTVLNADGEIAGVFAGELEAAHEAAARFARELFAVHIPRQADLVVAASPHTQNFVQTHKALFNAYQAVKPGGRMVLLAPCPEGIGGEQFVKWLALEDRKAIFAGLRRQSEINGQTALSTIEKGPMTFMVTELSADDVARLRARKADSLQSALDRACHELAAAGVSEPSFYLMPDAPYTVPFVSASGDQ